MEGTFLMRIGVFTVSAMIVIMLLGTQSGSLPQDNEDLGVLKITVDKCNYTIGEPVRITFSNIGNDNIWWPEEGAIWKVPFAIFDEEGDYVFVTIQAALTIPWALGPGEQYNTTWNQTYNALDTPVGLQVPPSAYRIYSVGETGGFPSNITTQDSLWIWIGLPCGGPRPVADAGPDIVTQEGEPVMLNGTGSSGFRQRHWEIRANITAPRYAFAHALLDGRVYVAGGYGFFLPGVNTGPGTTEVYDPVTDTWTVLPVGEMGCGGKPGIAGAAVDGRFYAFGEYIGPCDVLINSTEVLDETEGRWLPRANMPTPRTHLAVAVIDGKVYAVGGRTSDWNDSAANEVYDPVTDSWEVKASMPSPRSDLVAVVVQGRLYAIGGSQGNLVEEYDPSNDSWSTLLPIPGPRLWAPAAAVHRDLIYLVEVLRSFDIVCCSLVLTYNPDTGETLVGPEMNIPRFSAGVEAVEDALIAVGGTRIVKAGSILGPTNETEILQLSDPSLVFSWDMNNRVDSDGDGNLTNDVDTTGPTPTWIFGDNGIFTVTLKVTDESGNWDIDTIIVTVLNVNPVIIDWNYTLVSVQSRARTIGYWNHQCGVEEPYGNHTGILGRWISEIANGSILFSHISTKEEVCSILSIMDHSDMTQKAMQQLMALWLNLVSGKLQNDSFINLPELTENNTLADIIEEIEHIVLNIHDKEEMERTKDIADSINNRHGSVSLQVSTYAVSKDPGSDDLTFIWDWGDGSNTTHMYYNNGISPDPPMSPEVNPMGVEDTAQHSFTTGGSYTVVLTVMDDDGGSATITYSILVG